MKPPYEYSPIIADEHAFRIARLLPAKKSDVDIEIEIIHASLDEDNLIPYEAVSYVWGSPEMSCSVSVQGSCLKVTNNLQLVLRDLRLPNQERLLWIDGICINQNDRNDQEEKEKNHQVRQMGKIYRSAERVLFHLGRSTDLTPIMRNTLEKLQQLRCEPTQSDWETVSSDLAEFHNNFYENIRQSMESMLIFPWFRRIWIIQEVANARNALIHWGPTPLSVHCFVALVRILNIKMDRHQTAILDMMPLRRRSELPSSSKQDLYDLLIRFNEAQTSKDHDKIFALLGMCSDGKGQGTITVDYSQSLPILIRKAIAYMSYCDINDLPATLDPTDILTKRINSLLDNLVADFAINSKLTSLRSLLLNRGDTIIITLEILEKTVGNSKTEMKAVDMLLNHRPDTITVPIRLIENVFSAGRRDLAQLLLASSKKFPFMAKWTQTLISETDNNSPGSALGLTQFGRAVLDGKGNMKQLIREGVNVNAWGLVGLTPLGCATIRNDVGAIGILLENNVDVNDGIWPPLLIAAKNGQENIVKILLDHEADIESRDNQGRTALSVAVKHGRENVVKVLLEYGASIKTNDNYGRTPLSIAASGGFKHMLLLSRSEIENKHMQELVIGHILQYLKDNGDQLMVENMERRGKGSQRHLMNDGAGYRREMKSKKEILVEIFDSEILDHEILDDLFSVSEIRQGRLDELINSKLSNYAFKIQTTTPQIGGVYSTILQLLLRKCSDVDSVDAFGRTPLWWAVNYGHQSAVAILPKNKPYSSHVRSGFSEKPLLKLAVRNGHQEITPQLLKETALL